MRDWTPEIQYQAECNAGLHNYGAESDIEPWEMEDECELEADDAE